MDYLGLVIQLFGSVSLIETGIVLYLYHQQAETWAEAVVPHWLRRSFARAQTHDRRSSLQQRQAIEHYNKREAESKEARLRKHLYRQIFYVIDKDFNGTLDLDEISEFGVFLM